MDISLENIDNIEDFFITYILYKEGKTIHQISKIRNLTNYQVNEQLIEAKLKLKHLFNPNEKIDTDIIDEILILDKSKRLELILGLNESELLDFKRKLYKRIIKEKNAEDIIKLIWCVGELKDERFLDLLHDLTYKKHSDIRRITYSAIKKIASPKSKEVLENGLYDTNPQTKMYCAKALSELGDENTLKILRFILRKNNNEKDYVINEYKKTIEILEKR